MKYRPIEDRFWEKVVKTNGCWKWVAHTRMGYGRIKKGKKYISAHRYSWELHFGKIPKGQCVLHKCDNRPCTNPKHLWLGTQADNIADMVRKNRNSFLAGSSNPISKIKERDVIKIRANYLKGKQSVRNMAKIYDIGETQIRRIINKESWKHI